MLFLTVSFITLNALVLGAWENRLHTWAHVLPMSLAILSLTFFLTSLRKKKFRVPSPAIIGGIVLFALIALISSWSSVYPFAAKLRLASWLSALAIFLATFSMVRTGNYERRAVELLVLGGTIVAGVGLLHYIGFFQGIWETGGLGLRAPFINHNHLAAFLEMIIPAGVALLFTRRKATAKLLAGYGTFLMIVTHAFTLSRGGWISLGFGLGVFFYIQFREGHRKLAATMVSVFLVFLLLALYQIGEGPVDDRIDDFSKISLSEKGGRPSLFKVAIEMGLSHPAAGVGPGQFRHHFREFRPPDISGLPRFAHNDFLQIFAELGFPGLLMILAFTVMIIHTGFKSGSTIKTGLACGFLAISVHSMVDFGLQLSANLCLAAFITAIILKDNVLEIDLKGGSDIPAAVVGLIILAVTPVHLRLYETGRLTNKGNVHLDAKQYALAFDCFAKAHLNSPRICELSNLMGFVRYEQGRLAHKIGLDEEAKKLFADSITYYKNTIKANPRFVEAIYRTGISEAEIARITKAKEDLEASLASFEKAQKLDPLHEDYNRWLGITLFACDKKEEGLTVMARTLKQGSGSYTTRRNIVTFAYKNLEHKEDAIHIIPDEDLNLFIHLGMLFCKDNNLSSAVKVFEKGLSLHNEHMGLLLSCLSAVEAQNNIPKAIELATRIFELKKDGKSCLTLARLTRKNEDTKAEEKWIQKALELEPQNPGSNLNMALFLQRQGKTKEAKDMLERIKLRFPENYEAPYRLALICRKEKKYIESIRLLNEALKRAPDNASIKNYQALNYAALRLPVKAYRIWDRAIEEHPERPDLILNKAATHYSQKEYRDAVKTLKMYQAIKPDGTFRGKPLDEEISRIERMYHD